jgi:hypothetical protein
VNEALRALTNSEAWRRRDQQVGKRKPEAESCKDPDDFDRAA